MEVGRRGKADEGKEEKIRRGKMKGEGIGNSRKRGMSDDREGK